MPFAHSLSADVPPLSADVPSSRLVPPQFPDPRDRPLRPSGRQPARERWRRVRSLAAVGGSATSKVRPIRSNRDCRKASGDQPHWITSKRQAVGWTRLHASSAAASTDQPGASHPAASSRRAITRTPVSSARDFPRRRLANGGRPVGRRRGCDCHATGDDRWRIGAAGLARQAPRRAVAILDAGDRPCRAGGLTGMGRTGMPEREAAPTSGGGTGPRGGGTNLTVEGPGPLAPPAIPRPESRPGRWLRPSPRPRERRWSTG